MTDETNTMLIQVKLVLKSKDRNDLVEELEGFINQYRELDKKEFETTPFAKQLQEEKDRHNYTKNALNTLITSLKSCKDINQVNKIVNFCESKLVK